MEKSYNDYDDKLWRKVMNISYEKVLYISCIGRGHNFRVTSFNMSTTRYPSRRIHRQAWDISAVRM
jgi:hypothetical protein